jgi:hypothetical protein
MQRNLRFRTNYTVIEADLEELAENLGRFEGLNVLKINEVDQYADSGIHFEYEGNSYYLNTYLEEVREVAVTLTKERDSFYRPVGFGIVVDIEEDSPENMAQQV